MNVLVVGCGSIGRRRALLLKDMGCSVSVMDTDRDKQDELVDQGCSHYNPSVWYDAEFICTPAHLRLSPLLDAVQRAGRGIYIEKPLSVNEMELVALEGLERANKDIVMMVACNLRFTPQTMELSSYRYLEATFRMGQHERYWSEGHQPLSMALDSIHEIDLARSFGGPVRSVAGFSTENQCRISMHHETGAWSHVIMDRHTDPAERYIRMRHRNGEEIKAEIDTGDDMYVLEMEHFLMCVDSGAESVNPIKQAADTTRLALSVI